jgi:hypothetical protein
MCNFLFVQKHAMLCTLCDKESCIHAYLSQIYIYSKTCVQKHAHSVDQKCALCDKVRL